MAGVLSTSPSPTFPKLSVFFVSGHLTQSIPSGLLWVGHPGLLVCLFTPLCIQVLHASNCKLSGLGQSLLIVRVHRSLPKFVCTVLLPTYLHGAWCQTGVYIHGCRGRVDGPDQAPPPLFFLQGMGDGLDPAALAPTPYRTAHAPFLHWLT